MINSALVNSARRPWIPRLRDLRLGYITRPTTLHSLYNCAVTNWSNIAGLCLSNNNNNNNAVLATTKMNNYNNNK